MLIRRREEMNVFDLIKREHENILKLTIKIIDLGADKPNEKERTFSHCMQQIIIHNKAEEKTFYRYLKRLSSIKYFIDKSEKEHKQLELILTELNESALAESAWQKLFIIMFNVLQTHVIDEENYLFGITEKILTVEDAISLGESMMQQKLEEEKKLCNHIITSY